MRSTTTLLFMVIITLALFDVDVTVETIYKAASDKDAQVNYTFCVSQLANNPWNPNGDAWVLARVAAEVGLSNADQAIGIIESLIVKAGTDAKKKAPLKLCDAIYLNMTIAFANAHDRILERNYTAGKVEATNAIILAHQCDAVFAKADVPSPVVQNSIFAI